MALLALLRVAMALTAVHAQYPDTCKIGTDRDCVMPALSRWFRWKDTTRSLQQHVTEHALTALAARRVALSKLDGETAWQQRIDSLRTRIPSVIARGIPTMRTPLNTVYTKKTTHPGTNATVEMLHFESRPGFFVTGGLWRPASDAPGADPVTGKRAGILFASGHSCQAWRRFDQPDYFDYQFLVLNLVRKGFVVLAYDPPSQGERCMYCNGTCSTEQDNCTRTSEVGGCTYNVFTGLPREGSSPVEHSYYARQLLLNNITSSSVFMWDGSRALDLLDSLDDVDSRRIGMAGCSGGGTQTAYLSSHPGDRERIAASSTACYASSFEIDFEWFGTGDGEQQWNHPAGTSPLNKADLFTARAPAATQILLTSNDGCFPIAGGRMCHSDTAKAFAALGAGSNLTKTEALGPHGMMNRTRQALYSFFQQHLQGASAADVNTTEAFELEPLPMPRLTATKTGSVVDDLGSQRVQDIAFNATTANLARLAQRRRSAAFTAELPAVVREAIGYESPIDPGKVGPTDTFTGVGITTIGEVFGNISNFDQGQFTTKWVVESGGACGTVVTLRLPPGARYSGTAVPVVAAVVDTNGTTSSPFFQALNFKLVSLGFGVAQVTLCGFGEIGPVYYPVPSHPEPHPVVTTNALASFTGRTIVALHAQGLSSAIASIAAHPLVKRIHAVVAADHKHVAALHLAAIEPKAVPALAIIGGVASYAMVASAEKYSTPSFIEVPGVLTKYDLQDLLTPLALAPNCTPKCGALVLGPTDAQLRPLNSTAAEQAYAFARQVFDRHAGADLVVRQLPGGGVDATAAVVADWAGTAVE